MATNEEKRKLKIYRKTLTFKITYVFGHCRAKAQRYALAGLFPVKGAVVNKVAAGEEASNLPQVSQLRTAILAVQRQWRARMHALRGADWARFNGEHRGRWYPAMNCPPVSVSTDRVNLTPCGEYRVCPFCWSRHYARQLYCAVEYAVFGGNPHVWLDVSLRDSPRDDKYLYTDMLVTVDSKCFPMQRGTLESLLANVPAEREASRLRLAKSKRAKEPAIQAYGAYRLITIEPSKDADGKWREWLQKTRTLQLIHADATSPEAHPGCVVRRFKTCTREKIVAAVGTVCAYPEGMMRSPPEMVVELLNLRTVERTRLSSYFGALRNRSRRKRDADGLRQLGEAGF